MKTSKYMSAVFALAFGFVSFGLINTLVNLNYSSLASTVYAENDTNASILSDILVDTDTTDTEIVDPIAPIDQVDPAPVEEKILEPLPPEPNTVNLNVVSIVCDNESDLPNWGAGGPDITTTTATDFLDTHPNCHQQPWKFEWAPAGASNPGDNNPNASGEPWTEFEGSSSVPTTAVPAGSPILVREILFDDYIPFTGENTTQDFSAEFYCHTDVLNYDNYEYIDTVASIDTFFCVAFNAPTQTEQPSVTVVTPAGGELYHPLQSMIVSWTSTGYSANSLVNIDLATCSVNSCSNTFLMSYTGLANDGTETLLIPANVPNLSNYEMRVEAYEPGGTSSMFDYSNFFTITDQDFPPQCSDDVDNDGDLLIDSADAGCHWDGDANNPSSYNPNGDSEFLPVTLGTCGVVQPEFPPSGEMLNPNTYDYIMPSSNPNPGDFADHAWFHIHDTPVTWDMGVSTDSVLLVPSIDHEPFPGEAHETTLYGYNTPDGPVFLGTESTVYEDGPSDWISDNQTALWTFAQPVRYVYAVAGGIQNDGDAEIDALCFQGGISNGYPVADAGSDQTITLPTSSVTLDGSGSYDLDGVIISYAWTKISGPASYNIVSPSSVSTLVNALDVGTYIFQLTVTDDDGAIGTDTVTITVNRNTCRAVVVSNTTNIVNETDNAVLAWDEHPAWTASIPGASWIWDTYRVTNPTMDETRTFSKTFNVLPGMTSATLMIATDNTYKVSVNSSSNVFSATDANDALDHNFTITGQDAYNVMPYLVNGSNTISFEITNLALPDGTPDNNPAGLLYSLEMLNENCGGDNNAPIADAGSDQDIILPTNSATLNGSGSSDSDGTITSYVWTFVAGPSNVDPADTVSPGINNLDNGTYVFELTVADDDGATDTDTVSITVNPQGGGGDDDGDGGSSGGSRRNRGGSVLGAQDVCSLDIDTYMRKGYKNNVEEVKILQDFLNGHMGSGLVVDGVFGAKTEVAVMAFQFKYKNEILNPWGITKATGIVYKTTLVQIKNLMCPTVLLPIPTDLINWSQNARQVPPPLALGIPIPLSYEYYFGL